MSFQTRVGYSWPAGTIGEFATLNPRRMAVEGVSGFRAGAGGVRIGAFAWVQEDGDTVLNKAVAAEGPTGFVHRAQQGLATSWLEQATMTIPQGVMVTLVTQADLFVTAGTQAIRGQAVYAGLADGHVETAAPGAAPQGTVATGFVVTRGGAAGDIIIISNALVESNSGGAA